MAKFWVFIRDDGESWQTWGTLAEAIAGYITEHGDFNLNQHVIAIVSY